MSGSKDKLPGLSLADCQEFLSFAEELSSLARELIAKLWRNKELGLQLKSDSSPVTEVDLQVELLVRQAISGRFPSHGIIGEEYPAVNPESEYQWTLDPIDGTQNLVNGIPTFGTLIGLRFKEVAVVGVIDHAALDLCCVGGLGLGVKVNGVVVNLADLATEELSANDLLVTNSIAVFGDAPTRKDLFQQIMSFHPHTRIYYDCYTHTLALSGNIAVAFEPGCKIWDMTPIEVLIKEAGGEFRLYKEYNSPDLPTTWDIIFGKPRAVELLWQYLGKGEVEKM